MLSWSCDHNNSPTPWYWSSITISVLLLLLVFSPFCRSQIFQHLLVTSVEPCFVKQLAVVPTCSRELYGQGFLVLSRWHLFDSAICRLINDIANSHSQIWFESLTLNDRCLAVYSIASKEITVLPQLYHYVNVKMWQMSDDIFFPDYWESALYSINFSGMLLY